MKNMNLGMYAAFGWICLLAGGLSGGGPTKSLVGASMPLVQIHGIEMLSTDAKAQKEIQGKVIGVKDGDTIEIWYEGRPLVVRLSHIDCPELKGGQPYGNAAKQAISNLCFGKQVRLQEADKKDRNGRILAEVVTDRGVLVNQWLVQAGLAWHFKKYSTDRRYAALEVEARRAKRGLWADPHPVAPWDWRRNKKRTSI